MWTKTSTETEPLSTFDLQRVDRFATEPAVFETEFAELG
jgi:hypothetical protein